MSFLNFIHGELSINSYRAPNATVTTQEDILKKYENGNKEAQRNLTAIIDDIEEVKKYVDINDSEDS